MTIQWVLTKYCATPKIQLLQVIEEAYQCLEVKTEEHLREKSFLGE